MINALLALVCWLGARRVARTDPRRLRLGVLTLGVGFLGLAAVLEFLTYVIPAAGYVLVAVFVLLPLSVLVLAANLVRNGLQMRRREGRSLGNSLSLLTGVALALAPVVAVLLVLTLDPVGIGLALLIALASFQLGAQFVVFYAFFKVYERLPLREDPDAVVVLGSGLVRGRVPPLLRNRLDRGREVLASLAPGGRDHAPLLIASGGKGVDEPVAEGVAMREVLLEDGVPEDLVVAETRSVNTRQNLLFSRQIADEHLSDGLPRRQLLVVTNGYHVPRTALLSRGAGVDADVVGASTATYFVPSAFIREFIAVLRMHTAMNVILAALAVAVSIGTTLVLWAALGTI